MLSFILVVVGQYGPPPNRGSGSVLLTVAAVIIVLLVVIALILLFPRLRNVKPSKSIEPEVKRLEESKTGDADSDVDPLNITLRLLNDEEKKVVKALDEAGGTMLQKDISYELGLSRVKTHRTLAKLIDMDVVTAEKYFNTNRIRLADWLQGGGSAGSEQMRDEAD